MNVARTSTAITTLSALVLTAGGIALLFGSEELLALAMPGTAGSATVLGQLVAAGWLAVAGLNWNQRSTIVGGIYGRPMVLANFSLYMITAFSLAHPAIAGVPRARSACWPWCSACWRWSTPCSCCAGRSAPIAERSRLLPTDVWEGRMLVWPTLLQGLTPAPAPAQCPLHTG